MLRPIRRCTSEDAHRRSPFGSCGTRPARSSASSSSRSSPGRVRPRSATGHRPTGHHVTGRGEGIAGFGPADEQVAVLEFLAPDRGVEPPGRGDGQVISTPGSRISAPGSPRPHPSPRREPPRPRSCRSRHSTHSRDATANHPKRYSVRLTKPDPRPRTLRNVRPSGTRTREPLGVMGT
jgi:hypothetical protein